MKIIYVKGIPTFDKTGYMQPQAIIWEDSRGFYIDAVTNYCPSSMVHVGHLGDCYTVVIRSERKYLFSREEIS